MRWIWIDRFTEFESGSHASALKNVSLAEEYLHDHFPDYPVMPPTLIIEGMAQTAGMLVGEARGFKDNVVLAKIRNAKFDDYAKPGDQLCYKARIESIDDRAAATSGDVLLNGRQIGEIHLMFSHVAAGNSVASLPDHNFVFTGRFMELFEIMRADCEQRSAGE